MRLYDPEDVPQGKRFCTTCRKFFDPEDFVFMSEQRGVTVYLDPETGAAHTLLSERVSANRKRKMFPLKDERTFYLPPVPEREAAPSIENIPGALTPANQVTETHTEPPPPDTSRVAQPEVVKGNNDTGEQFAPLESTPDDWAMWEPQPDDWFEGRVKTVDNGFMFLTLTNGDDVFVPYDVVVQFPNGHRCVIRPGDVVGTRIEPSNKGNSQWAATEVYFQTQHEVPPEPESGIILWWKDKLGVVIRGCACRMFVRSYDVQPLDVGDPVIISQYEDSIDPAHPGKFAKQIEFAGEPE